MNVININHKDDLSADEVLEKAKGNYERVLIIGYDDLEKLDVRASSNVGDHEALFMIEQFKAVLMSEYEE